MKKTTFVQKIINFPKTLLNYDLDPLIDFCCLKVEFIFSFLERFIPALRVQKIEYSLQIKNFNKAGDSREHFIPARRSVVVDRLVESATSDDERKDRAVFAEMCAERFHLDFLKKAEDLHDDFAPFDPDSEAQYEREFSFAERLERRARFVDELKNILISCNFFELPKVELDRCLNLKRPGALPVVARYDDFIEYRIFVRGVVATPAVRLPRWKGGGRFVELTGETISRVCVLARLKKKDAQEKETQENAEEQEIVVKLFKDVALEELNLVAPRVEIVFQLFDGVKIGGAFLGGVVVPLTKLLTATLFSFLTAIIGFFLALLKSVFGFLNRRTTYLQKYSKTLYFKNLASNRAAVNLLVSMAEDQEIKEIILGYFAAASFNGWATEREIDDRAEDWIRKSFGLEVDFESDDALRKLFEKKLIESKIERDSQGNETSLYRVVALQEALKRLDNDWDNWRSFDGRQEKTAEDASSKNE